MRVVDTERIPVKVWCESVDEVTLEQAEHLARLPFAFHHVALMSDAHPGFGMPIGGVLAARDEIVPNAVGVDIGCGVLAWDSGIPAGRFKEVRDLVLSDVQRSVPTGFQSHRRPEEDPIFDEAPDDPVIAAEIDRARLQLGTLGGGNHFIEAQRDPQDVVWFMVHSGSRNLGKKVADHYNAVAVALNATRPLPVPDQWRLCSLSLASEEGRAYNTAMEFCLRFAAANRQRMAVRIREAVARRIGGYPEGRTIQVRHNYASQESHYGQTVMVHRKGAIRAVGELVIPGSMATASYLGQGLANQESFMSCSHGSGRVLARKEALRLIPVQSVVEEMRDRDVRLFKQHRKDLPEEAPAAYKDIDRVMAEQADLVTPTARLIPLGVVKG